jgi:hypothetical protein
VESEALSKESASLQDFILKGRLIKRTLIVLSLTELIIGDYRTRVGDLAPTSQTQGHINSLFTGMHLAFHFYEEAENNDKTVIRFLKSQYIRYVPRAGHICSSQHSASRDLCGEKGRP